MVVGVIAVEAVELRAVRAGEHHGRAVPFADAAVVGGAGRADDQIRVPVSVHVTGPVDAAPEPLALLRTHKLVESAPVRARIDHRGSPDVGALCPDDEVRGAVAVHVARGPDGCAVERVAVHALDLLQNRPVHAGVDPDRPGGVLPLVHVRRPSRDEVVPPVAVDVADARDVVAQCVVAHASEVVEDPTGRARVHVDAAVVAGERGIIGGSDGEVGRAVAVDVSDAADRGAEPGADTAVTLGEQHRAVSARVDAGVADVARQGLGGADDDVVVSVAVDVADTADVDAELIIVRIAVKDVEHRPVNP